MPLPSLWINDDRPRVWNTARVAGYGAALGTLAAVFKIHAPWHEPNVLAASATVVGSVSEVVVAALGFALLCAGASALRNILARRLIWPD